MPDAREESEKPGQAVLLARKGFGLGATAKFLDNGGDESDDPTPIYPRTKKLPCQAGRLTCPTLSTEADLDRRGRAIFSPTRTSPNSPLLFPPTQVFSCPTDGLPHYPEHPTRK